MKSLLLQQVGAYRERHSDGRPTRASFLQVSPRIKCPRDRGNSSWAERAVALGSPVDTRLATVAAADSNLPAGWLSDYEVIFELASRIGEVATSAPSASSKSSTPSFTTWSLRRWKGSGNRWMFQAQHPASR